MISSTSKRWRRTVPITVSLTALMLALAVLLGGVLITMSYQRNTEAALLAAEEMFEGIALGAAARIREVVQPMIAKAAMTSELRVLRPGRASLDPEVERYLAKLLRAMTRITSVFYGFPDGEFVQYVDLQEHGSWIPRKSQPPQDALFVRRWLVDDPVDGRIETIEYLDESLSVLAFEEASVEYDPRQRSWYREAIDDDSVIATDPYVFASSQEIGVTVARRVDEGRLGVFGIDVTFASISAFLQTELPNPESFVALIDQDGLVLAHTDRQSAPPKDGAAFEPLQDLPRLDSLSSAIAKSIATYLSTGTVPPRTMRIDDREYVVRVKHQTLLLGSEAQLVIAVPIDFFTGPILELGRDSLLASLAVLVLSVPVFIVVSTYAARSLKKLATEAMAIRDLRLEGPVTVHSKIREIAELAEAMDHMKAGLRTFGFYLPRDLTRQLVEQRITPKLGGERREITVLFTDIADFTSIAETLEPEIVMRRLSDYFELLTAALREHGGVVDKFMGDAVMVEWNAIVNDPDHAATACRAVLHARKAMDRFNQDLIRKGLEPMETRFGLNTGQAVVGNVGSTERMDFTALGSTVNLAARLEPLNKYFGTKTLISDAVAQRVENRFCTRSVALVQPKGIEQPLRVHELLCESHEKELNPMAIHSDAWESAFEAYVDGNWEKADAEFTALSQDWPEDALLTLYAKRVRSFRRSPPSFWTGVEVFENK